MKNKGYYEKVFSEQRMEKYFISHPNNSEKAILHYKSNIELSESFYSVLSIFEVALRNSLNRELSRYFETQDWYLHLDSVNGLRNLRSSINLAQNHISKRNETITANKVIAELTLGFWVRLLNAEYERILWKPLRMAFPNLDKSKRQRNNVSAPINKIREFRNRVFHHEPISWKLEKLDQMHSMLLTVMQWMDKDLPAVVEEIDRVPQVLNKVIARNL